MPSLMKSTLSLMAFIAFIFVLWWATYSIVTGIKIDLPDWIVASVSWILSSYATSRMPNNSLSQLKQDEVPKQMGE